MRVVIARGVDLPAGTDKVLDQLRDRQRNVRALGHAESSTVRVGRRVGGDKVVLHVDDQQRILWADGADVCWRTNVDQLEVLLEE